MFCKKCGYEFEGNFCPKCGLAVAENTLTDNKKVSVKKPFYKKWWVWLIGLVLIIGIASANSSGDGTEDHSVTPTEKNTVTEEETTPPTTLPKIPAEFLEECPVTVSASVEDNIIGVPQLSCHIQNNTDKEIAAVQLYFIPKDVYGDKVNTIFTTNKLYTDSPIDANSSETVSWQLLDDGVKSGEIYIYSVYFDDGTEWGNKDASVSNIKKYGTKIITEE